MAERISVLFPTFHRPCDPAPASLRALTRQVLPFRSHVVASLTMTCVGLPDVAVQRSLTLIAKVVQSLANLNPVSSDDSLPSKRIFNLCPQTVQKEEFMRGVKDFLTNSLQAMIDYIIVVSTPEPGTGIKGPLTPLSSDKHERLRIMNALRHRSAIAPVLQREAIPLLPHLLDIPRHLAVVTSVVVRYSRTQNLQSAKQGSIPDDKHFAEFCTRCMEVEEQALFRVSKLAAKPRRQHSEPVINIPPPPVPISPIPSSPSSSWKLPTRERKISASALSPTRRRTRKSSRPSTAPSSPERGSDSARSFGSSAAEPRSPNNQNHPPLPSPLPTPTSPNAADRFEARPRTKRPTLVHHPRSTSTDSPLARKPVSEPLLSPMSDSSVDASDEAGKRRKNIFRSILTRR